MSLGVIVDLDGTFVDSNDARTQAWLESLAEHDYRDVSFKQARRLVGLPPNEFLANTIGFGEDAAKGRAIRDRCYHIFHRRYLKNLTPFFRGPELVHYMRASGLRVSPATTDPEAILNSLLRLVGAEPLLQHSVHGGILGEKRSIRDMIKAAIEMIGLPSNRCLLVTASPHHIEAAKHLNIPSIAFRSGYFSDKEIDANLIYDDAEALFEDYENSPIAPQMAR